MDPDGTTVRSTVGPGLGSAEARTRLAEEGPNVLPAVAKPLPVMLFVHQLTHLLAVLLWVAAGLALLAGMPILSVAIVVVVLLNAVFAFLQEYRADRSAERLRSMLPVTARVLRDGEPRTVPASEVVRGDVVLLGPGDRVVADIRLGDAHAFRLDESMVTGESQPISHGSGDAVLAGTFVVQGEADGVVTATGADTTLAEIAKLASTAKRPPSPLTVQLTRVVRVIALIAAATGTLLGLGGMFLGLGMVDAFLFGVGVTVALVPEGLLPTVTLSLAHGAQRMADRKALVRRLDAVETLGATTYICTDKTGTLTQNRMMAVEVWTRAGLTRVSGDGYEPSGVLDVPAEGDPDVRQTAAAAARCVTGRVVQRDGVWVAEGDPMEAALHCLALRSGAADLGVRPQLRLPYTADRMMSSVVSGGLVQVLGAPERVFARCAELPPGAEQALHEMTGRGRRVVAVADRSWTGERTPGEVEDQLALRGLVGLEDPPRDDVAGALDACRRAEIRVAMVTGDHPATAAAVAREVGLLAPDGLVVVGGELPEGDAELAALLDRPEGVVVARVSPADKFRIARVLREQGHVVAMTGDGVNDAPALREADVGVAMGLSGSDVAREAADLILLDDHFGTIVGAVELGRATFANVRRFLTYHLTDNVAELAPFAAWALTAGQFPLALSVLQILALDIGTDMLPALALGAEPPSRHVMEGRIRTRSLVDRPLLARAFGALGATEATAALVAFALTLTAGGWTFGEQPKAALLALASGTAFATIALAQIMNAFACRSTTVPFWRVPLRSNPLLLWAVAAEVVLLLCFVGVPGLASLLGGSLPTVTGWLYAVLGGLALLAVDTVVKLVRRRRR